MEPGGAEVDGVEIADAEALRRDGHISRVEGLNLILQGMEGF